MNANSEAKFDSNIYAGIQAARMSERDRQIALNAMRNADLIVDALIWVVKKIEHLTDHLFLKPSLKH